MKSPIVQPHARPTSQNTTTSHYLPFDPIRLRVRLNLYNPLNLFIFAFTDRAINGLKPIIKNNQTGLIGLQDLNKLGFFLRISRMIRDGTSVTPLIIPG